MEAERFKPEEAFGAQPSSSGTLFREEVRTCRIERWRGYVTSSFFVLTDDGLILESRRFRWRHAAPPAETKITRAAYDELVDRLVAEGWSIFEDDTPWFATTLARTVLVPVPAESREPEHMPAPAPSIPPPQAVEPREEQIAISEHVPEPEPEFKAAMETEPEVELLGRLGRIVATSKPEAGQTQAEQESEPGTMPAVDGPEPQHVPPGRWWRPRSLLLAVPVAAVATVFAVHSASAGAKAKLPAKHVLIPRSTNPERTATGPERVPQLVHVTFVARGSGSWVEARRGSKTGRVLYSGILEDGRRLKFSEPRLWVEMGAAGNLFITSNGRPVVLRGTYAELFRPGTD